MGAKTPRHPVVVWHVREFITTHLLNRDGVKFPDCTCLEITIELLGKIHDNDLTLPLVLPRSQTRKRQRGHQPPKSR